MRVTEVRLLPTDGHFLFDLPKLYKSFIALRHVGDSGDSGILLESGARARITRRLSFVKLGKERFVKLCKLRREKMRGMQMRYKRLIV